MYKPLCPCPGCSRHVLATERACPFCNCAMPEDFSARVRPEAPRRLSRMAALALGTSLSLGACSDTVTGTDGAASDAVDASADVLRDAPPDDGAIVALYGDPPPTDAGADVVDDDGAPATEYGAPVIRDAAVDDGAAAGMYGAPPPRDASTDAVDDQGAGGNLYGAPPPRDAATDDAGADGPLYGAPPPTDGGA